MRYDNSSIGLDPTFELDHFARPRFRSETEFVKNLVLHVLFSKPGQYPSLPFIGMDIETKLSSFYDEINDQALKDQVVGQCNALGVYFGNGRIDIRKVKYKDKPSMIVHIELEDELYGDPMHDNEANKYMIGITFDEMNNMIYDISEGRRN